MGKKKEKLIVGWFLVAAGLFIMISTLVSGAFYSKITLSRLDNAVYISWIGGKREIARLMDARSFKMKASFKKGLISLQGNLCYNLEMTKADGEKEEVFPFCVSRSSRVKHIAQKASSFLAEPQGLKFSAGIFSLSNLLWFLVAFFAVCVGIWQIISARGNQPPPAPNR